MGRARARGAFTLFEVAISLAIVATGVLSAALLFPLGIRAQHLARFQLYAGAKMLELSDAWAQQEHCFWERSVEGPQLGQNAFIAVPQDLEQMLDGGRAGMLPLPSVLARRLDADGDEIRHLIDDGGLLYYAPPNPCVIGADERGLGPGIQQPVPPEAQTLVFGVEGYAQQNALPNHPCLAWPYYDWWPSPPQAWELDAWRLQRWPGLDEMETLYAAFGAEPNDWAFWGKNDQYVTLCQRLVEAVCAAGDLDQWAQGPCPRPPPPLPVPPWADDDRTVHPAPWTILAMRYLAHACHGRCLSQVGVKWNNGPDWGDGGPWPSGGGRQYTYAVYSSALAWAMRYAATSPYDWGAPRPLNRQSCCDFPLLEQDLFPSPAAPFWTTPDGDKAWRVCCALPPGRTPDDVGQARGEWGVRGNHVTNPQIPANHAFIAQSWGDNAHFNLTARFAAAERCRMLVCWSVDWRAYEDAEVVPAEPMDALRCFVDSQGVPIASERVAMHPEYPYFWRDASRTTLARDQGNPLRVAWLDAESTYFVASDRSRYENPEYKRQFLGVYGADRNGDGVLTRGPVPASARMRALLVARFPFYDKRMLGSLRN